jgi:hypothetical protein
LECGFDEHDSIRVKGAGVGGDDFLKGFFLGWSFTELSFVVGTDW